MYDPIQIRRELHRIPEMAFQEHQTQAFLKGQIEALLHSDPQTAAAFSLQEFKTSTGLLLVYKAAPDAETFQLFRADMDALPLSERTGYSYSSQHDGCMHACGHDVHMAVLMGLILRVWKQRPARNLLFLFQPAEEGQGGAQSILAEGLIQQYQIAAVFALHVAGNMPVGSISSKAGIFFGIPQEFDLYFSGKAAHVAFPEYGINALGAAIDFFARIQADLDELAKSERFIFHVGKMQAGRIRNVIADQCSLEGTHRTLNKATQERLNELIAHHAKLAAEAISATAELKLLGTYDAVVNDAALYKRFAELCETLPYHCTEAETVMTGEDFGFFTSLYPGLLFWLGSGSDYPLHSPQFLASEACVQVGIDVMYALIRT